MFTFVSDGCAAAVRSPARSWWPASLADFGRVEAAISGAGGRVGAGWWGCARWPRWWASGRRVGGADEVGGGLSAAFAVLGCEPVCGSPFVLGLAGGEGVGDAQVARDEDGAGEQRDRGQSGES